MNAPDGAPVAPSLDGLRTATPGLPSLPLALVTIVVACYTALNELVVSCSRMLPQFG